MGHTTNVIAGVYNSLPSGIGALIGFYFGCLHLEREEGRERKEIRKKKLFSMQFSLMRAVVLFLFLLVINNDTKDISPQRLETVPHTSIS